jgi:L-seryl-tRNA(Ser) seleniumtransferase
VRVVANDGAVGGGGAPELRLPGWALAVPASWAGPLRAGSPPVVGTVRDGCCLLDLRCVPADRDADLGRVLTLVGAATLGGCPAS